MDQRGGSIVDMAFLTVRTESLDPTPEQWLRERCEVVHAAPGEESFETRRAAIDALVVRTYTIVDKALLDRLPNLKVVGRAGVGVDNIDLASCRDRGVRVVYTPDANTQAVVEYVTSLFCDALRPRVEINNVLSKDEWTSVRATVCATRQMSECTFGVLGLGRIGSRMVDVASAIGFAVQHHDVRDVSHASSRSVSLAELLATSDVLTIHVDGRASNKGFMNAARIAALQDNVVLINTSRGFVIDEASLASWLSDHPAALATLDVHEREPIDRNDPLLHSANARLLPHLASRTNTGLANMSWVVRDVWNVLEGREPMHDAVRDQSA